jgi:hypothetical protein
MMSKLALVSLPVLFLGCAPDDAGDRFGDEGTPSASAQELLGKADPITSDHLAGVYERTGSNSGIYPGADGTHYSVYNKWIYRTELRETQLVTVFQCNLTYNEPGRAPKSLLLFTQQAAEATDEFYRIAVPAKQLDRDNLSMSECSIDQPATAWAYCLETNRGSEIFTKLPEGANLCIGRWDQDLMLVDTPYDHGDPIGKKVAN